MSNNNDNIEMQTFQIYSDDEADAKANEAVTKNDQKAAKSATKASSGGSNDTVKGIAFGVGIAIVFVLVDMFVLSK